MQKPKTSRGAGRFVLARHSKVRVGRLYNLRMDVLNGICGAQHRFPLPEGSGIYKSSQRAIYQFHGPNWRDRNAPPEYPGGAE